MLESLTIENFAIIEKVNINFTQNMTVLSGETGAGKSIIIDALGVLCGGRGSADYIRQGSDKLVIEGLFTFQDVPHKLSEELLNFGIETNIATDNLIIRREINLNGKNTIRINGQLANVSLLKQIGAYLVDIHGQNEHQDLLDKTKHLGLLDQFGGDEANKLLHAYLEQYNKYQRLRSDWLDSLQADSDQRQRLSFLEFQIQEIDSANLVANEDTELEGISLKLQNAQQIGQNVSKINYFFSESDESLLTQFDRVLVLIEEIQNYEATYPQIYENLTSIKYDLEEYGHQLASVEYDLDDSNQSLDSVESRLAELSQLKRKYGMSVEEILNYYNEISEEVYQIKHRDRYLEDLQEKLVSAYETTYTLARKLHQLRQQNANQLINEIEEELNDLYMGNSSFTVSFAEPLIDEKLKDIATTNMFKLSETGFDDVEFYVSTNIGEAEKPLVMVASGGELSRFMLALKSVFSQNAMAKVMVFDEIDTGVSGRVAQAIAEKIRQVARHHQVLCITHLPQVAAISNQQLYISKQVEEGRTRTIVSTLTLEERQEVIALMISGRAITQNSLELAKELLAEYH